jgi:hypothetical protein
LLVKRARLFFSINAPALSFKDTKPQLFGTFHGSVLFDAGGVNEGWQDFGDALTVGAGRRRHMRRFMGFPLMLAYCALKVVEGHGFS